MQFKVASGRTVLDQIHRLNYQTFVDEIPQHQPNPEGALVDAFDTENTYLICVEADQLIGMVAVRDTRPFSLEKKVPHLDSYLPAARSICEFRLLTVERRHRHGAVFLGLAQCLAEYRTIKGYDLALISALETRVPLYERFGFVRFAYPLGRPGAMFQPMYLTLDAFERHSAEWLKARQKHLIRDQA